MIFSIISLDFLSANLTGSGTRYSETLITIFIADYKDIFVPVETYTGFFASLPVLKAAPHIFPLYPSIKAKSPEFFIFY